MRLVELQFDGDFGGDIGIARRDAQLQVVAQRPRAGWDTEFGRRRIDARISGDGGDADERDRNRRHDDRDPARDCRQQPCGARQSGVMGADTRATQRAVSFSCTAFCLRRASSPAKSTSSSG